MTKWISPPQLEEAIKKLPSKFGAVKRGKDFFIRCPDHARGAEKTPSMLVNATTGSKFHVGSGHCFSCGAHYGSWRTLRARLYGYEVSKDDLLDEDIIYFNFAEGLKDKLLTDNDNNISEHIGYPIPWDGREWRDIPSDIMQATGSMLTMHDKFGMRAFLPCYIDDEMVGGINANLEKQGKRNYFNTPGDWANTSLYPFDYVFKTYRKTRCIVLVEGPRDCLKCLSMGIPTLAILGAGNAANEQKFALLDNFNIKTIILAYDGDDAGREAIRKTSELLRSEYNVGAFKFDEGDDPCKVPLAKMQKLQQAALKYGACFPKKYKLAA